MDRDLITKFMEVTGEGEAIASQYLTLADGNLESAITLLFEAGGGSSSASEPVPLANIPDEPEVREPILPTQEILVPPDITCTFPRASNNVFDRFRDFAVETRRQEEEMTQRASGFSKKSSRSNRQRRLEDLFRPPCDLLFLGTFSEAREYAKSINKWLLVNVQNQQEFACQILNRDIWPNKQIREIVKDHFVLLQILSTTDDGKRYIDFYKVQSYPYVAIIDPRTGECMRSYNHITVDSLISGLNDMLSTHASPENIEEDYPQSDLPEKIKANTPDPEIIQSAKRNRTSEMSVGSSSNQSDLKPIPRINSSNTIISKRSRLDELAEKEKQIQVNLEKDLPVDKDGPTLKVCLRLPNGCKETVTMFANETVANFLRKMSDMGYDSTEYTYLIPFPKTNIGDLSSTLRLMETILYPSNTVFITKI